MAEQPTSTLRLLLKPPEAARALAISARKLWSLTDPRGPIPCIRVGRAIRYDPRDLEAWIEEQKEERAEL